MLFAAFLQEYSHHLLVVIPHVLVFQCHWHHCHCHHLKGKYHGLLCCSLCCARYHDLPHRRSRPSSLSIRTVASRGELEVECEGSQLGCELSTTGQASVSNPPWCVLYPDCTAHGIPIRHPVLSLLWEGFLQQTTEGNPIHRGGKPLPDKAWCALSPERAMKQTCDQAEIRMQSDDVEGVWISLQRLYVRHVEITVRCL